MSNKNNSVFIKAVRFMYDHIDQTITLDEIANSANVSRSTLKRIFADVANKTPGQFLSRLRMELAFRSLQNKSNTVLQIALSAGFDDHSAFARCFKETFGYSPSDARKKLNIVNELESVTLDEPDIVDLQEVKIQCITQQGIYYESAKKAWDLLKAKLSADELSEDFPGVFIGIGHDNPHEGEVMPDQVRYSAGVAWLARNLKIVEYFIPAGKYARFHYVGKPMNLGMAYHYIYGKWAESSEYKINKNIPAFMCYEKFPEALKEEKIMICVPVE